MLTPSSRACAALTAPTSRLHERAVQTKRLYRADDLAAMPTTRAELERDRADFTEGCRRAETKGGRALELLRSRECNPRFNSSISRALTSDYDVKGRK